MVYEQMFAPLTRQGPSLLARETGGSMPERIRQGSWRPCAPPHGISGLNYILRLLSRSKGVYRSPANSRQRHWLHPVLFGCHATGLQGQSRTAYGKRLAFSPDSR